MFYKSDVRATLMAYDPTATPEHVDSLYQQIATEWEGQWNSLLNRAVDDYHEQTGLWPDGVQRGEVRGPGEAAGDRSGDGGVSGTDDAGDRAAAVGQ